ncbi:hypothetical protein WJ68_05605 [Burkholderia ubonensis]|uniref:Uncharacterized protein n=1 Tax=Burkholderia ubonensis TaxID=101571 RepID=A0ABD4E7T7_9BURK|nr:hypothetical protein WJ68_05605 [Burkholderia ubonensis]
MPGGTDAPGASKSWPRSRQCARSASTHATPIGTKRSLLPLPITRSSHVARISPSAGCSSSAGRATAAASAMRRPASPINSSSARAARPVAPRSEARAGARPQVERQRPLDLQLVRA